MRRIIIRAGILAGGALLAAAAPATFNQVERAAAQKMAVEARRIMEDQLVDYPAARIRNVRAQYSAGMNAEGMRFCGEINARNRAGGYNGWRPFIVFPGLDQMAIDDSVYFPVFCDTKDAKVDTRDWSADLTHR